ncbi:MAG: TolB family protein [Bellilinea sp.]
MIISLRRIDRGFILVMICIGVAAAALYSLSGRSIHAPRAPLIAFIGNPLVAPEIWSVSIDGSSLKRLTSSGGAVYDFSVSPDGAAIVYSVHNSDGSSALYRIDRDGGDVQMLVDCAEARCETPAWSNAGQYIAYSQIIQAEDKITRGVAVFPLREPLPAEWPEKLITGTNPVFSPDSQKLAMNNPEEGFIRILDLSSGVERQVQTSTPDPVTWASDSNHIYFNENEVTGILPQSRLFQVDLASMQIVPFLPAQLSSYDAGGMKITRDGVWAAFALRSGDDQAGRQIYISKMDGSQFQAVTDESGTWHTAIQWSPDGGRLVFQEYTPGTVHAVPRVVVWDRVSGEFIVAAENGALPTWLP